MKEIKYIPINVEDSKVEITDDIINLIEQAEDEKIVLELRHNDFTSIKIENQNTILSNVSEIIKKYKLFGIKISSIPDSIDKNNLKMLKKYKVKEIELLIESSNNYILKQIGADYKFEYARKISKKIKFMGFLLSIKTVIGLPESTSADDLNTIKQAIKFKPEKITLIPCQENYNKNTQNLYNEDEFAPLSKIQLIERLKECINLIGNSKIKNIKIGEDKQIIDNLNINQFRSLLASEIWYDRIIEKIKSYNVKVKIVNIEVNENDVDFVKGANDCNLNKLKDVYDVELKVIKNNKLNKGNFKMDIVKTYTDFLDDEN